MRLLLLSLFTLTAFSLAAQPDDYHAGLVNFFNTQYTLTGETYPLHDSEAENYAAVGSYNVSVSTRDADADQDFSQVKTITSNQGINRWDAGWNINNSQVINQGDRLLWVVWLRALPNANGDAEASVGIFAERNDTYAKEVDLLVDLDGEWRRYFIPFEALTRTHPVGGFTIGFHLAAQQQVVEVGGFALFNYRTTVPFDQLPSNLNNEEYGGFEQDAAWRGPAADRIEEIRKADINFTVLDTEGAPLPNSAVSVRMQEHDFEFGSAIKACRFPSGNCVNTTFQEKYFDLDGRGHGFNATVYENDLKWPAWEDEWISPNSVVVNNINYFGEQDVHIRGHVLLWPGWDNLPERMFQNRDNPEFLVQQVENHITEMLQTRNFDENVTDWDVLNEINTNTDLAAALAGTPGYVTGREIYVRAFELARELAPDAELYINDYITMSLKNTQGGIYEQYQNYIQELVDANAPVDGIGFQAHLSSSPNSIYDVLSTLDDFHDRFGLRAKITEYDLQPGTSEELAADYTVDFLTAIFSHESVDGFFMWNWWDTDTWANPGANFYRADWSATPAKEAFVDLVFDQWWTEEDLMTNASGQTSVAGFKGRYLITVDCNGQTAEVEMSLLQDGDVTLDCGQLVSLADRPLPAGSVFVSPNPSPAEWLITNNLNTTLSGQLFDLTGRSLWTGQLTNGTTPVNVNVPAGVYTLRLTDGNRASSLRLVRR